MVVEIVSKIKLDIGCGRNKQTGSIGLDIVKLLDVDVIADISKGFPFKDNSFDEIFCYHILEHFEDPIKVLEEIWRISKPDAMVFIKVPYCQSCGAFRDPTHKSFFHEDTMKHFTESGGLPNWYSHIKFDIIENKLKPTTKLTYVISKIPKLPKILWNVYSEIEWKLKVVKEAVNEEIS